jgi:hypothetical protein
MLGSKESANYGEHTAKGLKKGEEQWQQVSKTHTMRLASISG